MALRKFYVVFEGRSPGIYDSWDECQAQVDQYPGAKYKSFPDQLSATQAFRQASGAVPEFFKAMATAGNLPTVDYSAFPEINPNGVAVDAACSKNPGPVEYQGVMVGTGQRLFHMGPLPNGTNNIGEYLALVHAAALLAKQGDTTTPIYTDSRTALAWLRCGHSRSTLQPTAENSRIIALLQRADAWMATHSIPNPIIKWQTERWGEIPADFGRK